MDNKKSYINFSIRTLNYTIDLFNKLYVVLSSVLMLSMVTIICLNVILRYLLNYSLAWSIELSEYILVYVTFLTAPWLLRTNEHIVVDVVYEAVSPKTKRVFKLISNTLGSLVCLVLTVFGFIVTWDNYVRDVILYNSLLMPKFILLIIIPVSGLLMFFEFCLRWFKELHQSS